MPVGRRAVGPSRKLSRRQFLTRTGRAALAVPGMSAILAVCGKPGSSVGEASATGRPLARPDRPVTLPLRGRPIPTDTPPEKGATLRVYNWADYIWKKTLAEFEDRFDCTVEYQSFFTLEEAVQKIQSDQIRADVYFPGPGYLAKVVYADLVQPLNHDLIPNMEANVWKLFWDPGPWYDRGWRYSVPYTLLTTGVAYRRDRVDDREAASQGYDLLWNATYSKQISYYDSYRDAMGMAILRNGGTDVNSGDPDVIDAAKEAILQLVQDYDARLTYNGVYAKMAEGEYTVAQAWSGDVIGAQWYLPKGTSTDVLGYWYPSDRPGLVGNDIMSIPSNAENPRLAHEFINVLLDDQIGFSNFAYWTGYMPPIRSIDADQLIDQGVVPPTVPKAIVTEDMMQKEYQLAELDPEVDQMWQNAWDQIKAGG
jgi:spermidine/putrescine transport system substrate-binding protein